MTFTPTRGADHGRRSEWPEAEDGRTVGAGVPAPRGEVYEATASAQRAQGMAEEGAKSEQQKQKLLAENAVLAAQHTEAEEQHVADEARHEADQAKITAAERKLRTIQAAHGELVRKHAPSRAGEETTMTTKSKTTAEPVPTEPAAPRGRASRSSTPSTSRNTRPKRRDSGAGGRTAESGARGRARGARGVAGVRRRPGMAAPGRRRAPGV